MILIIKCGNLKKRTSSFCLLLISEQEEIHIGKIAQLSLCLICVFFFVVSSCEGGFT